MMPAATLLLAALLAPGCLAQQQHAAHHLTRPQRRLEAVAVVEPVQQLPAEHRREEEVSLLARIVGEETQGKVVDSIVTWAKDKARENPGCVERFVCEMYKTGETLNGIPYLLMSITK